MRSMRKVLGVDPGKTTGISFLEDGKTIFEHAYTNLDSIYRAIKVCMPNVIVIEKILGSRNFTQSLLYAAEAIGVCRMYAQQAGIKLVESNPAILQGKVKPKGLSPHIWSARNHALWYIAHEGKSQ